jgi:hypothetical protein
MVEGVDLPRPQRPAANIRMADRGYFETMGIRAIDGRLLDQTDRGVAVIGARTAARLWPGQNPIGRRFRHGADDSPWVEVVGVVNDVRAVRLTEDPPLSIYRPVADYFYGLVALTAKTATNAGAAAPAMQRLLRDMDPAIAVPAPRTMSEIVTTSVAQRRFQMTLTLMLAVAATFLAALGIYGVVSQLVTQRTAEFGIRMALGADTGRIVELVLRRAMTPVLAGLGVGVAVSIGVGRFLRALLFGVQPTDAAPLALAGGFLLSVALIATLIPARRAARLNPLDALRSE